MDIINKNSGVTLTVPQAGDFIAGVSSPIVFEARNIIADWGQFRSAYQRQSDSVFDTQGCVSYSCVMGCIAPQINWMLANNLLPAATLDFLNNHGYIVNGKVELSERAIVVWSKTTPVGNSGQNVIQTVRAWGIPSAKTWPNLLNENQSVSHDVYYQTPSDEAFAEAKEFLKYFAFAWEFFSDQRQMGKFLQQSPLQDYTPVCPGWGSDPVIQACNQPIQHATAIQALHVKNPVIEDQYPPFVKELAPDYIPASAPIMRIICNPIPQPVPVSPSAPAQPKHPFTRDIVFGERSTEAMFLQARLGIPQNGIYDNATASAVFQFQLRNLSQTFLEMVLNLKGRRVGPRTRAVLNQ